MPRKKSAASGGKRGALALAPMQLCPPGGAGRGAGSHLLWTGSEAEATAAAVKDRHDGAGPKGEPKFRGNS